MSEKFKIVSYGHSHRHLWDEAASRARQASFLFRRAFMDYHSDRFKDISLMAIDRHGHVAALFPANVCRAQRDRVESHGGLTYGGMLLPPSATTSDTCAILSSFLDHYRSCGFSELLYKPVPHIYHTYPAEEDLYALFRQNAVLLSRSVSSVIDLRAPYPFSTLRKRKAHKAENTQCLIFSEDSKLLEGYWDVLERVLEIRHATKPAHTAKEMRLLMERFPEEIRLFTALCGDGGMTRVLAGCIVFLTVRVAHVQYIAASDEGCHAGALDWLFEKVLDNCQKEALRRPWLDFGISTEQGGHILNEGLVFQKEGFGGRAVCYDTYKVFLK